MITDAQKEILNNQCPGNKGVDLGTIIQELQVAEAGDVSSVDGRTGVVTLDDLYTDIDDTKGLANDGSDNFNWQLLSGKKISLLENEGGNSFIDFNADGSIIISSDYSSGLVIGSDVTFSATLNGDYCYNVKFDESGVTALTGSGTATSIIGVINDLNARITALEP